MKAPLAVFTAGHSTRTADEFFELLRANGIVTLADVRRFPGSRRHPQFSQDRLRDGLAAQGIGYTHFEDLGGRRTAVAGSPNGFWRNASFRGYADYMSTPEFAAAITRLTSLPGPAAVMCAEAVPWRCHRNLIADELTRRGVKVLHILSPTSVQEHAMNPAAVDEGSYLIYSSTDQKTLFS